MAKRINEAYEKNDFGLEVIIKNDFNRDFVFDTGVFARGYSGFHKTAEEVVSSLLNRTNLLKKLHGSLETMFHLVENYKNILVTRGVIDELCTYRDFFREPPKPNGKNRERLIKSFFGIHGNYFERLIEKKPLIKFSFHHANIRIKNNPETNANNFLVKYLTNDRGILICNDDMKNEIYEIFRKEPFSKAVNYALILAYYVDDEDIRMHSFDLCDSIICTFKDKGMILEEDKYSKEIYRTLDRNEQSLFHVDKEIISKVFGKSIQTKKEIDIVTTDSGIVRGIENCIIQKYFEPSLQRAVEKIIERGMKAYCRKYSMSFENFLIFKFEEVK